MTYENFCQIKDVVYRHTGINLSDHKQNMVYGRLARRLRALKLSTFDEYCALIESEDENELKELTNAITTNLTAFFRENHHFEFLKNTLIPGLILQNASTKRIRIWSAGCSTGEEPYSIAMVLNEFSQLRHWDAKILATDLDSNVVAKAKTGRYQIERTTSIPANYKSCFEKTGDGDILVSDSVSRFITFKQLNLLHQWPMKGPFDLIFCRNVVIYFDVPTQKTLFNRYADLLKPNGHLIIGHSENLNKVSTRFKTLGKTIYQKES